MAKVPNSVETMPKILTAQMLGYRRQTEDDIFTFAKKIANRLGPSHFGVRLIHQRKISFSLSLSHLARGRSKFTPLLICGKVIPLPLQEGPLNPAWGFGGAL